MIDERLSLPLTTATKIGHFALRVVRGFRDSNGVVLAGAMAYSALLSTVPLAMLLTAALSNFIDPDDVSRAVRAQLRNVLLPGQVEPLTEGIETLIANAEMGGLVGVIGVSFFATSGFRVLQAALDQVFAHRRQRLKPRPLWKTVMLSLGFIAAIGLALTLRIVLGASDLPALGEVATWLGGYITLAILLSAVYRVMPLGGLPTRAALLGGFVAAGLWEILQFGLSWYFGNISTVNLIFGSMASVVLVLFTLQTAGAIILVGAQVIAEVERSWRAGLHWYQAPAVQRDDS